MNNVNHDNEAKNSQNIVMHREQQQLLVKLKNTNFISIKTNEKVTTML